ncbi:hypothetical protein J421_3669 [Gemmatirosa kalamazoonensis]|uniref:Sortilin N-terminal domain-containing protein n=1 Tax=Gemmatirosa kalamazoonensis TaxID=861299 RepID=W0RKD2_9BACT|nr:hypothetical protein [Gemmatirosa kalamazoonensis]AHG91206.1 hypothetical protein J421_3669 [Gemmatirosa kalamazoonensis]
MTTPPDLPGVSRRDFVLRAGQLGAALSLLGPRVTRALGSHSAPDAPPTAAELARLYGGLRWRMLGPFRGGRVDAVSGVPGRPHEFYFGHVNGGVWKTVDGGRTWDPVFDDQPVPSIGALAVAPSAPDVVYVGTGESTLRDSAGYGNGVYKSTDAGRTWTHLGLDDTQHIGKIAIDPRDPNVAFVAAIGHLYAANPTRGVFRTRDGGRTWEKVLYKGPDVGAVEVVIDPTDSRVVYAGLWNTRRPPWYTYAPTNGPGGGIFKSTDGGSTWTQLTNGLPAQGIGRTGIAVSPTNPRRVYAVVDCLVPDPNASAPAAPNAPGAAPQPPGQGGFFRSDDAGATWTKLSGDTALWGRGWYFEKVTVDPKDPDTVYVPNVAVNRSMDGGHTWQVLRGSPGGDDYHQFWVSPDDPNTAIVASDQGAVITRQARAADPREVTWTSWLNQPTAQLYHLSVDYRFPYWVTGAQQDSGAVAVRSRGKFAEISTRDWEPIGAGGESGYTAGDPLHPGIIFGGMGGRYDLAQNVPINGTVPPRADETMRADWTQPLVFSKADPHALYYGSQFVFKTTDGAKSWTRISPDLTRPEGPPPPNLDETAAKHVDRNGKRGVVYTIAPSPLRAPLVWAGTDDGRIHVTSDDGATWQDVTPKAVSAWSRVTMIDASHFDAGTAYASVDRHQLQDFAPYVYRTRDGGKTWQRITNGLPAEGWVHTVKEDRVRRGLLFCGTERALFVSFDDGEQWLPLQLNLPTTSMRDLEIYEDDLIVATHGRGFWVIDDIAPLRQFDPALLSADAFLFKPSDAINYVATSDNGTPLQKDEPQAANPPNGVAIDYWLRAAAAAPVTLEIVDSTGSVVRAYGTNVPPTPGAGGRGGAGGIPNTSPLWRPAPEPFATSAGMHRVVWNPVAAAVGRGGGGGGGGGGFGRGGAPLFGAFTARLTVGGRSYTQTFTVKPDPRSVDAK